MRQEEERNHIVVTDFMAAAKKDKLFINGRWPSISKQNSDLEILKVGLKTIYEWEEDNVQFLASGEDGNYKYLLFSHQQDHKFPAKVMALYNKQQATFRTYDAFYYKNYQHPELIGKWKLDAPFGRIAPWQKTLYPLVTDDNPEEQYGDFLEINEDYSFKTYQKSVGNNGCDALLTGHYDIDARNEISLFFDSFSTAGICKVHPPKNEQPFYIGPYTFTEQDGMIILKRYEVPKAN